MINLNDMIEAEIENGYGDANAQAKVCQDVILKAISASSLSRNVTIKGGVVMRSKTKNIRRATQDLDIDFIRYSLANESIDMFVNKLNCIDGLSLARIGDIEELKQQDYHGKRVYIEIKDSFDNVIISKLDLGVHNRLDIEQEEYCFDIAFDEEGASLLINSNEQMFAEKLRSLLRFGAVSTRYKDIFDLYFLKDGIDVERLKTCLDSYIYNDSEMREKTNKDISRRVKLVFSNRAYLGRLRTTDKKWLDEDLDEILKGLVDFIDSLD